MVLQLQSEDNEKKTEVVGKADNNKKEATKEQRQNKNIILNKDENIEANKSEGEVKGEDEQYGKPNQQCQKHHKVFTVETKTKDKEKENTNKTNKLETRHFKLHQETLGANKIEHKVEHKLKGQTEK